MAYRVESNDPGLNGQAGSFVCAASDLKGSIRPMRGAPTHFERQDGSPFWWLGDTAWALYTDNETEKHDRAAVEHYLDVRASQGFNIVHSMLISEADWGNSGGMPFEDLQAGRINPAYWREVDSRLASAGRRDILAGLVLAWTDKGKSKQSWQHFPSEEARLRYARYIAARYSAFPVYFIVAGEWNIRQNSSESEAFYNAIGRELAAADPHGRMIGIHPVGRHPLPPKAFIDAGWNAFGGYQQVYSNLHDMILQARANGMPAVNAEYAYYRRQAEDGTVNKANSEDADTIRAATWDIAMAGGYIVTGFGSTYFGGNRTREAFEVDHPKNDDWEEQARHVRAFFAACEWWKLEPNDRLISAAQPRTGDRQIEGDKRGRPPVTAYWALAEPGRRYAAYVRGIEGEAKLTLEGAAANVRFSVRRYDPRTGRYAALPEHRGAGELALAVPDRQDWAFEVRLVE